MGTHNTKYDTRTIKFVIDHCATGDVILMSGHSPFSALIKCFTQSPWTHVGVVYNGNWPDIKNKNRHYVGPFILQSIISNEGYYDYLTGTKRAGVQLNSLEEVLKKNKGKTYWRKLIYKQDPIHPAVSPNVSAEQVRQIISSIGKSYESNIFELIQPIFFKERATLNKSPDDSYFCSELVMEFYRKSKYVYEVGHCYRYGPLQFADGDVNFRLGYSLGKIRKIQDDAEYW